MNLQDQISRILKEEIKMNFHLRRRFTVLDNQFHALMSSYYRPDNICRYKSGEELLDVIIEDVIGYFDGLDYNSEEWNEIYNYMVKYFTNKYGEKIKQYYHISCGD